MKIKNKVSAKLFGTAVLSCVLLLTNCQKDIGLEPLTDENLTSDSIGKVAISSSSVSSNVYRIENSLPKGYVKDGSKDYTSYVQSALNKYSVVAFPGFPILVNDKGLIIPSNRRIYFLNGSELRLKPTSNGTYAILNLRRVSNVKLIDPVIVGDRKSHKGTKGEWGIGISIKGCKDITITGGDISQCWGDGLYVDGYKGVISENIKISGVSAKNNRRDGISICSVDGLQLRDSYFGYSSGVSPQAGVNIEAEGPSAELKNIRLSNIVTEKNGYVGIQLGLSKMYGGRNKSISVEFTNIVDKGSVNGFKTSCYTDRRTGSEIIKGSIDINQPNWQKNTGFVLKTNLGDKNVKLSVLNPSVTQTSGRTLTKTAAKSVLLEDINRLANYIISW